MSKVSVIIPAYNVEKYLPECLDSVLAQTHQDLEVIAIDDCSPDRCGEILDEYAARDDRVQVIHLPENRGQGYGRNRGLERAVGKYVYFLDSDDVIEPDALGELTELADRDRLDAIFFDSRDIYESEELKKVYKSPFTLRKGTYRDAVYAGKDLFDDFIRQGEWTCYPQRIFWNREFLLREGIRYPEDNMHEDEFFAFAGILAAAQVRYVRKAYFTLRIRPDSVMTSEAGPKNFHGYLMNYYYMCLFVAERGIETFGSQANISRIFERARTLYAKLKDDYDLQKEFAKDPDKKVFCFYKTFMTSLDLADHINPEVLDQIRQHRVVYIYGAKYTGQRFCEKLERLGDILIGGFIAQDPAEVPPVIKGRRVYSIDEIDIPEDAIVVAAVKIVFWEETRAMMEERNIKCIFHRKLYRR